MGGSEEKGFEYKTMAVEAKDEKDLFEKVKMLKGGPMTNFYSDERHERIYPKHDKGIDAK